MRMAILGLAVIVVSAVSLSGSALAVTSNGLGYTCSSNGTERSCTCEGVADCDRMNNKGVCGNPSILECTATGCTCKWPRANSQIGGKPPKNITTTPPKATAH